MLACLFVWLLACLRGWWFACCLVWALLSAFCLSVKALEGSFLPAASKSSDEDNAVAGTGAGCGSSNDASSAFLLGAVDAAPAGTVASSAEKKAVLETNGRGGGGCTPSAAEPAMEKSPK